MLFMAFKCFQVTRFPINITTNTNLLKYAIRFKGRVNNRKMIQGSSSPYPVQ